MYIIIIIILSDLIGFSLLVPIYPLLQGYYHITDYEVGYFVQIWALFLCLGGLVFGIISDKTSRKRGLLIPIMGSCITYFLMFFADTYTHLLICRAFNGFFSGNFVVAMAAASDISTDKTRLKNMSAIAGANSLSWVIGPMLGGLISSMAGSDYLKIHLPFLFSSLFSLLAIFLALFYFKTPAKTVAVEKKAQNLLKDFMNNLKDKKNAFYSLLNIILMALLTGSQIYFSLWVEHKFHISIASLGIIWGVFAVAAFLGQVTIHRFLYAMNPKILIILGFVGMGISYVLWGLSEQIIIIYILGFALFYFGAFTISGINTRVSRLADPDYVGFVFGINQGFAGIGRVLAPTVLGSFAVLIGYNATWIIAGSIFLITAILCMLLFSKYKQL